jgi:peptide/nickel transport system substrate-binding protein
MNRNQTIAIVVIIVVVAGAGVFLLLPPPPPTGQTLVYETYGNPEYMDPHNNYESFGSMIAYNVYETLYTFAWGGLSTDVDTPLLASDLTISSDGLTYTFTLQHGVTFQDGTPFNASCVQYNFERMLGTFDPSGPVWMVAEPILGGQAIEDAVGNLTLHTSLWNAWCAANAAGTGAVTVIDDYTVAIKLAYPFPSFLDAITYQVGAMISPSFVEKNGGITVGSHNPVLDREMCGTGPYMLGTWLLDGYYDLKLNPNYWRASQAKSLYRNAGAIDEVIIYIVDEANSRMLDLKSGQADIITVDPPSAPLVYNRASPPTFATYDGKAQSLDPSTYKVFAQYPQFTIASIHFDLAQYMNETTLGKVVQNPYYLKSFRECLSYALDYDAVITDINNDIGVRNTGPIPKDMFGHNDSAYMFPYDLDMAKTAWNEAMANDGLDAILTNNTNRLIFYYNTGNEVRRKTMLLLKDGLDAMLAMPGVTQPTGGLTIDVQGFEWTTYLGHARHQELGCYMIGWIPDYADPDNYMVYVKSTGTYAAWSKLADQPDWDATYVNGLIQTAARSLDDNERIALYGELQDLIINEAAYIWVYQYASLIVEGANTFNAQTACNPSLYTMYYFYHMWKTE